MKTSLRLSLSVLALGLPLLALAAPDSVSGITAKLQPDGIAVQWDKVDGDISMYRVFYSHASILNNGGLYDDFEEAAGTDTTHLLRNVPPTNDVYVAVLAVNAAGEESPYFTEEAHVALAMEPTQAMSSVPTMPSSVMPTTTSSMPVAMPSSMMAPTEDVLRLLSVEAISATGVVLHFSHVITVDPARATEAVTIETASGTKLAMKRFIVQGNELHIDTADQERGTVYKVTVGIAIGATGSAGQRLAISPDQAPVLFSGHPTGHMPSSMPSSTTSTATRTEVQQLRLRAQPVGSVYRVETTWQPAGGMVKGYSVAQTTDGGKTFGEAKVVQPEERDLIVNSVPAGTFGVRIKTIYTDDTMSKGIVQTIQLPKLGVTTPIGATVKGGSSTSLPNSGPGLWVAIAATAAAATWLQTRRKQPNAQVA